MFITFEGLDFSGKTTQAKLLVDRLQQNGKEVVFLREPGGTNISEKIREILLDKQHFEMTQKAELFLFSAARTQLVDEVILPAIKEGKIVLCDRFFDSTTAYQGYGRGLDLKDIKIINAIAAKKIHPDLTFFIDVDIEEIINRRLAAGIPADRMESSGNQFFEKVRQGYRALAISEKNRFMVINGMKKTDEIHKQIWEIVNKKLEDKRG